MGSIGADKRTRRRVSNEPEAAPVRERPFDGFEHIQGIGDMPARRVRNLEPGDILLWNYGYTSVVQSITPIGSSGKMATIVTINSDTGKEYTRRVKLDTKFAVTDKEIKEADRRSEVIRLAAEAKRASRERWLASFRRAVEG